VTKWLTAEWFDRTTAMSADQPLPPGLSARIQYEVTGGPEGDVSYHEVLEDGHLLSRAGGVVGQPDVTVTTVWGDAVSMCRGELDPNVAFMQGRMKVAGSMGVMLALLPVNRLPAHQELRRRIAEITEF
jgi:SCP-2 sterol transfer family